MGRLTQKKASGWWHVNGIPWKKLQAGEVITKETAQLLYGCLCKLKDYEDTGMSPEHIEDMQYDVVDMAAYVCDELCRHPREITEQEELDEVCEGCPVEAYVKRVLDIDEEAEAALERMEGAENEI